MAKGEFASEQTSHPSPCRKRQVSSVSLFLLFPRESLRWIRAGAPPLQSPLKRPRRGLMPPSWIIPGGWFVQSISQASKKRDADAYQAVRRGSRNTLRLFRLPYVKYSTGANITICAMYRALRKPDLTVARRAFLDGRCNGNTHNGTTRLFARKRYFRVQRLFFAYFFLARQKKVCPRSDSCGVAA